MSLDLSLYSLCHHLLVDAILEHHTIVEIVNVHDCHIIVTVNFDYTSPVPFVDFLII